MMSNHVHLGNALTASLTETLKKSFIEFASNQEQTLSKWRGAQTLGVTFSGGSFGVKCSERDGLRVHVPSEVAKGNLDVIVVAIHREVANHGFEVSGETDFMGGSNWVYETKLLPLTSPAP
jgi:hypothetical protein